MQYKIVFLFLFLFLSMLSVFGYECKEGLESINSNDLDVVFHENPDNFEIDTKVMVKNQFGQLVEMQWSEAVATTPRYNPDNFFIYGPQNYVPDYTESILLSRSMFYQP